MISSTQLKNWMSIGLEQPVGSLAEDFYYDQVAIPESV
jgi:hypothetical protein